MSNSLQVSYDFQPQDWVDMEPSWAEMFYLAEAAGENNVPRPLTSTELLKQYDVKVKRLRDENVSAQRNYSNSETLSSETIMKLAKVRLLQLNSQKADILTSAAGCFGTQSGRHSEVSKDLELALLLQAAAEKVANQQLVSAKKLLTMCRCSTSKTGSPVQRVVYYFAEALQERIDREWGIISSDNLGGKDWANIDMDYLDRDFVSPEMTATQQEHPFCLVNQFVTSESISENVASHKRVHLIDFAIGNGSQWILIMQDFAARKECPIELLKITAVGTSKTNMEKAGEWLSSFAHSINLPFSFKIIVSDLKNVKKEFFEIEKDEAVAVYFTFRLWTLLAWPNHLKALMGVMKSLKPCVMLVRELEVCTATPIFLERFNAALFFMGAMFDCVKTCLDHHILFRKQAEEVYLRDMICNIVIAEGSQRHLRHEKIASWRAIFARFGVVETDLSNLSLLQGELLLKRSDRFSSCSLVMDGKCLIMGWNGFPLESISAWKFEDD